MKSLFRLPCLLGTLGIACICALPMAYAAELEGTVVPVDGSAPVQVQIDAPAPDVAPVPPPADSSESQAWQEEQAEHAREQAEQAREQAERAHEQAAQAMNHQNWERDWEKNLNQVFENGKINENTANLALLIPILLILFFVGGPIILMIMLLMYLFGSKRRRQRDINMNIDKLLANGRDIPIELLRGDEPKAAVEIGNRDKGIRNIFLGAGWLVFLTVLVGFDIGAAGLIWIALGTSQVLIWHLNRQETTRTSVDQQAGSQD